VALISSRMFLSRDCKIITDNRRAGSRAIGGYRACFYRIYRNRHSVQDARTRPCLAIFMRRGIQTLIIQIWCVPHARGEGEVKKGSQILILFSWENPVGPPTWLYKSSRRDVRKLYDIRTSGTYSRQFLGWPPGMRTVNLRMQKRRPTSRAAFGSMRTLVMGMTASRKMMIAVKQMAW